LPHYVLRQVANLLISFLFISSVGAVRGWRSVQHTIGITWSAETAETLYCACTVGEVDFRIFFFIFNSQQFAIDGKNNSKTKV
jgi:hypothetical protein